MTFRTSNETPIGNHFFCKKEQRYLTSQEVKNHHCREQKRKHHNRHTHKIDTFQCGELVIVDVTRTAVLS